MQVSKAVITAAAPNQNRLPLQQLVDRSGEDKTALQLVIEETVAAGIEEICVVIRPGDRDAFAAAAGNQIGSLHFVEQPEPLGYADAIFRARDFTAGQAFLHLVGDHLYLSDTDVACATQLIQVAEEFQCNVSAVESTRENNLPYFGVVSGPHVPRHSRLYEVERVVEKPTPTLAEQELVTPGLRAGHYLGFFGMHVLTDDMMQAIEELLAKWTENPQATKPTLSDAASLCLTRSRYLACQLQGRRCNLGVKYGVLKAQLAIGLSGNDRDEILTNLVDLLARRPEAK